MLGDPYGQCRGSLTLLALFFILLQMVETRWGTQCRVEREGAAAVLHGWMALASLVVCGEGGYNPVMVAACMGLIAHLLPLLETSSNRLVDAAAAAKERAELRQRFFNLFSKCGLCAAPLLLVSMLQLQTAKTKRVATGLEETAAGAAGAEEAQLAEWPASQQPAAAVAAGGGGEGGGKGAASDTQAAAARGGGAPGLGSGINFQGTGRAGAVGGRPEHDLSVMGTAPKARTAAPSSSKPNSACSSSTTAETFSCFTRDLLVAAASSKLAYPDTFKEEKAQAFKTEAFVLYNLLERMGSLQESLTLKSGEGYKGRGGVAVEQQQQQQEASAEAARAAITAFLTADLAEPLHRQVLEDPSLKWVGPAAVARVLNVFKGIQRPAHAGLAAVWDAISRVGSIPAVVRQCEEAEPVHTLLHGSMLAAEAVAEVAAGAAAVVEGWGGVGGNSAAAQQKRARIVQQAKVATAARLAHLAAAAKAPAILRQADEVLGKLPFFKGLLDRPIAANQLAGGVFMLEKLGELEGGGLGAASQLQETLDACYDQLVLSYTELERQAAAAKGMEDVREAGRLAALWKMESAGGAAAAREEHITAGLPELKQQASAVELALSVATECYLNQKGGSSKLPRSPSNPPSLDLLFSLAEHLMASDIDNAPWSSVVIGTGKAGGQAVGAKAAAAADSLGVMEEGLGTPKSTAADTMDGAIPMELDDAGRSVGGKSKTEGGSGDAAGGAEAGKHNLASGRFVGIESRRLTYDVGGLGASGGGGRIAASNCREVAPGATAGSGETHAREHKFPRIPQNPAALNQEAAAGAREAGAANPSSPGFWKPAPKAGVGKQFTAYDKRALPSFQLSGQEPQQGTAAFTAAAAATEAKHALKVHAGAGAGRIAGNSEAGGSNWLERTSKWGTEQGLQSQPWSEAHDYTSAKETLGSTSAAAGLLGGSRIREQPKQPAARGPERLPKAGKVLSTATGPPKLGAAGAAGKLGGGSKDQPKQASAYRNTGLSLKPALQLARPAAGRQAGAAAGAGTFRAGNSTRQPERPSSSNRGFPRKPAVQQAPAPGAAGAAGAATAAKVAAAAAARPGKQMQQGAAPSAAIARNGKAAAAGAAPLRAKADPITAAEVWQVARTVLEEVSAASALAPGKAA